MTTDAQFSTTAPPHAAARLSRLLWDAREATEMFGTVVEARTHIRDRYLRRLTEDIDQFRREQGWSPTGFGGEAEGQLSDGDHTFRELYAHRVTLFALACRLRPDLAWRSLLHHDGTRLPGWFIAGLDAPTGPVSYHAPLSAWDEFDGVATLDRAREWDGHTPADVLDRLRAWRPGMVARRCARCGRTIPVGAPLIEVDDGPAFPRTWLHKGCAS